MTLVMTMGIGSTFTLMTSDERLAWRYWDRIEPIEDEREVKIHTLTDNVLLGWGQSHTIATNIIEELSKVVKPDDTLDICKDKLEEVTKDIIMFRDVVIILSGFYPDGTTGMVMKKTDTLANELKLGDLEYRYSLFPPTGDYNDRQEELMHIEDFTPKRIVEEFPKLGYEAWLSKSMQIALNHLVQLHGIISHEEPKATTPEGFYYLMYKDTQGKVQLVSGEFDTKQIHEQLKKRDETG